jgi:predicted RNA-binding protein with PUA-like domain
MKMKKGDRAVFFHSNIGKDIVGIVEVIREHHPDATAKAGEPWVAVGVKAVAPIPKPVSLAAWSTIRGFRCSRSRRRNGRPSAEWAG